MIRPGIKTAAALISAAFLLARTTPLAAQFKVHQKNIDTIGQAVVEKSLRGTSIAAAALTTTRFCTPRMGNFSQLRRTILRSGYLAVFSDPQNGFTLYAHPTGAAPLFVGTSPKTVAACGGVSGNRSVSDRKVKSILEKNLSTKLSYATTVPNVKEIKTVWRTGDADGPFYSVFRHRLVTVPIALLLK